MDICNQHDIPVGPILSMKEIAEEPSLRATGTIVEVDHPTRGKYLSVGLPVKMSDSIPEVKRSPLLGEHTEEILREVLNYDDRKVADLMGSGALTAPEGKLVCDAYGIAVPQEGVANSAEGAAKLAKRMGFPVVLKIVSPDILHKTEAGGVLVGLKSDKEVAKGYATILANAKKYKKKAKIEGVQVQQMVSGGQEVIVGTVTDGSL